MIRDIVVNLSLNPTTDAATAYAISVADTFRAHLAGIAFVYEPIWPPVDMGASMPASFIEAERAEAQERATAAIAKFEESASRAGLSAESHALDATMAGASRQFAEIARRFDLAIVGQARPDKESVEDLIAEAALFDSGRPVLFVPYIHKTGLKLKHVTVCWDGSRAATRAIADTMPFLKRAKTIDIVIIESEKSKSKDFPGADIANHLARHDLKIDLKRISLVTDVGNTILNYAADSSTDLIVMGGYGHSRFREFILGGATRGLLASMTVPTLMSH